MNDNTPKHIIALALMIFVFCAKMMAQQRVAKWGLYETALTAKSTGNPFDETVTATFVNGETSITVGGFYDGNNTFRIRFMPTVEGKWTYTTT